MGHDTSFSEFPEQPRCFQVLHDQAIQGTEYGEQAKVAPMTTKTSTNVLILKQQDMSAKFQRYQNLGVYAGSDMHSFKRNQNFSVYADKISSVKKNSWQNRSSNKTEHPGQIQFSITKNSYDCSFKTLAICMHEFLD